MAEPVVRAEGFGYSYPEAGGPSLLDVSLELEPGTFTVLAGLSGSGKSTLLRALCGLVPHVHGGEASGRLVVGGLDVREHGPGELAAVCGTVFQEPEAQVVMGGVRAELEDPREFDRTLAKVSDVLPSFAQGAGFGAVRLAKPEQGEDFYELTEASGGTVVFGVVGEVCPAQAARSCWARTPSSSATR